MRTIKFNGNGDLANILFGESYGVDWQYKEKGSTEIQVNIPDDNEIEQVATDEAEVYDSFASRAAAQSGFKNGANWMFRKMDNLVEKLSKKRKVVVYKDGSWKEVIASFEYENDPDFLTTITL